ncbi:anti-sigma factor [Marinomonas sp. CT5]|uniref:cupin domain-containing protein n=1 Tax=Marinomonas sp. CT5 TaxID=2066133 RepID=UPI001BAF4683|nr:cupin domain-containing protein [Marinomonas sp. CT5]QUX97025.1 anti-sigma factor [Marinomonas sp. CT5]
MLNMDFAQTVFMDTDKADWVASPMSGVYRKPLAREEAERGHATSLVKYEAGSVFRPHPHPLGEEILVLDGVFSDQKGDFKAGSYFRNPPGSSHAPHSIDGCLLLVKLHQFQVSDLNQVYIDTPSIWSSSVSEICPLYEFGYENVYLVRIQNGDNVLSELDLSGSVELFIISGQAQYGDVSLPSRAWFREPRFRVDQWSVTSDCLLWLKSGHF